MEPLQFLHALQVSDSFFPVGAFAYSDGLETAAARGDVHDARTLGMWMEQFVDDVFIPCEGLALVKGMIALERGDLEALRTLDEELTAIRPAAAVRAASSGVGKSLMSLYASISGSDEFRATLPALPCGNAAAAYAVVFFHRGLAKRDAAIAYGYNRLAGIVSAGLRLISIGQQQGQTLLTKSIGRLPGAVERILETTNEPVRSFTPLLDIHQMNHRYVYSRLFRS